MTAHVLYPSSQLSSGLILSFTWIFGVPALVSIALRLFVRLRITQAFGKDDVFVAISSCFLAFSLIALTVGAHYGAGVYAGNTPNVMPSLEWSCLFMTAVSIALVTFKLAVILLLERIFPMSKAHRVALYSSVTLLACLVITWTILSWVYYAPFEFGEEERFGVWVIVDLSYTTFAYSAFLDLVLALYPGFRVWNLQMPRAKRIKISILMSLSIFATIMGILKCVMLSLESISEGYLGLNIPGQIFTILEVDFLALAASAPTLMPLFKRKKPLPEEDL